MKFAQFYAGQIIEEGPYVLSEEELLSFANAYDPQWFHVQPDTAASGPFKGLIASGWHSCSIAMNLMVKAALHDSESFASPGLNHLKWLAPVRAGDSLSVKATILETRVSASKPTLGVLRWRWQLFNQDKVEVLDLEATSLFDLTRK